MCVKMTSLKKLKKWKNQNKKLRNGERERQIGGRCKGLQSGNTIKEEIYDKKIQGKENFT